MTVVADVQSKPLPKRRGTHGANLVGEYDSSSNVPLRRYVHGPGSDEPLARYTGAAATAGEWLAADPQGSIVAVTSTAGAVTTKNTYDEYGVPGSGNSGLFQYTGQAYLADLSLYQYKARAYQRGIPRLSWVPDQYQGLRVRCSSPIR